MDDFPPDTRTHIGEYRILERLGEGAMGCVYRAIHESLGREVALKIVQPDRVGCAEVSDRFRREMRLAADFNHRNLVKVLEAGLTGETPFIAMELVKGQPLDRVLADGPLPWPRAIRIAGQLAAALAYLHARSVLHRDVKPANALILPDDAVKLVDLGLSRRIDDTLLTQPGKMVGTLIYLAPENLSGVDASEGSDIWALGCVFYQLLTGQHPICGAGSWSGSYLQKILNEPILDPRRLNGEVPAGVAAAALALLERDPARRSGPAWRIASILEGMDANPMSAHGDGASKRPAMGRSADGVPVPEARTAHADRGRIAAWRPEPSARLSTIRANVDPVARPKRVGRWIFPMVAILALAVAGAAVHVRRQQPQPATGSIAVTPIHPDAVPASPSTRRPAIWGGWQKCEHLLSHLQSGKSWTPENVSALRGASGLNLGADAGPWIHWIQLGRWFADGGQGSPPARRDGVRGPLDTLQVETVKYSLTQAFNGSTARRLEESLNLTGIFPEDSRSWLALSAALAEDGERVLARRARQEALAWLAGIDMRSAPEQVWPELALSLLEAGGNRLEHDWIRVVAQDGKVENAWAGLNLAMGGSIAHRIALESGTAGARYRHLLELGQQDPRTGDGATEYLGYCLFDSDRFPETCSLWNEYLRAHPTAEGVRRSYMNVLLHIGYIDEARAISNGFAGLRAIEESYLVIQPYLTAPVSPFAGQPAGEYGSQTWGMTSTAVAVTLLQAGRTLEAERILRDPGFQAYHLATRTLCFDLAGAGAHSPWVLQECHRQALASVDVDDESDDMNDCAGALATPAGTSLFEELLSEATAHRKTLAGTLLHALHFSRKGQQVEADRILLQDLARCGSSPVWALEIAMRPLWRRLLTGKGDPGRWTLVRSEMQKEPTIQRYLDLLGTGQITPELAAIARSENHTAGGPLVWGLAVAYQAAVTGDRAGFRLWHRRLTARIRVSGRGLWCLRELDWIDACTNSATGASIPVSPQSGRPAH